MLIKKIKKILLTIAFCLGIPFIPIVSFIFYLNLFSPVLILKDHYPHTTVDQKTHKAHYSFKKSAPKTWMKISDISKFAKWSVVLKEDWAFYQHEGIDLTQLKEAVLEKFTKGKRVRGASTISQQVIKNLFLTSKRSFWRKFKEAIFAYQMEQVIGKEKILEIYLNIIEYGLDLYGIENAANFYFQKSSRDLSPKESAFLAILLPSPKKYSYSFRKKELTPFARFEMDRVLIKLRQADIYTEEDRLEAIHTCFDWESVCFVREDGLSMSEKIKNPGPIIPAKKEKILSE